MKKHKGLNIPIIAIMVCLYLSSCVSARGKSRSNFYFPPQWEQQESVWLGWSLSSSIQQMHLQMAKAVHPFVGITILARSDSLLKAALLQLQAAGVDTSRVQGYVHYIPNVFIRDAGPRFLKSTDGKLAIADFGWNNYGYPKAFEINQYSDKRGEIDNDLAKHLQLDVISTQIVAEGGGLDVSQHAILGFRETALQRNPGKTIEAIEKEYLWVYGKQQIIWLNQMPVMDKVVAGPKAGNYFGYGANGHIDEFARFVNDSTILISQIDSTEKDLDPVSLIDYKIMNENLKLLQKARTLEGKPFRILVLPTPAYSLYTKKEKLTDSSKQDGDGKVFFRHFKTGDEIQWLPAVSYANFFVTNGVVLLPKYWQEGLPQTEKAKDEKAKQLLKEAFPDRQIIQINPMALNRYGGGMNCATQQQPKRR